MNGKVIFGFVVPAVASLFLTPFLAFGQAKQSIADTSLRQPSTMPTAIQNAKVSSIRSQTLSGDGFTYRHDWGDRSGNWRLNLNWDSVTKDSRVFVAIGECAPGGGKFLGDAKYTLHNVTPHDGGVGIWVDINWASPIRLCADYLVVNP